MEESYIFFSVSTTMSLLREVAPLVIVTQERGTRKYSDRSSMTSSLARPLSGAAFTRTLRSLSPVLSTPGAEERGWTLTLNWTFNRLI